MRNSQRPCRLIQEDIAFNRGLNEADNQHVLCCSSCSNLADKVKELDSLVHKVIDSEIRPDFADRVVEKLGEEESKGDRLFSLWLSLLERIFYSRAVQWVLVGIGSIFGLFKIFRFVSAILVHGYI